MGEDFIRKTEKPYRRSVQRKIGARLVTPPLLASDEVSTTTYPCRTLRSGIHKGTRLLLHRCGDGTLEAVAGHQIIGRVEREPALDLQDVFDAHPSCADLLTIEVVSEDADGHFEFMIPDQED